MKDLAQAPANNSGTNIVDLKLGSIPWESSQNMNAMLINMLPDIHGTLRSFPVPQTLLKLVDYYDASRPITILAILRASQSNKNFSLQSYTNTYLSNYMIISTRYHSYTPEGLIVYGSLTWIQINEIDRSIVRQEVLGGTSTLNENFVNRGKFFVAQNSENECLFIDDNGQLFRTVTNIEEFAADTPVTYSTSRVYYSGSQTWGSIGTYGEDAVTDTSSDGLINYRALLNAPIENVQGALAIIQDYGIIYNSTQNVLFLTESAENFGNMLWLSGQYPIFSGTGPSSPGTLTQTGTPNVIKAPGRVLDMCTVNSSLILFTQDNIVRYNLVNVSNNPTLQLDATFNRQFKMRLNSGALCYQGPIYFITQDDKMYIIADKGAIVELTDRILPDNYYFQYNQYTKTTLGVTQTIPFFIPRVLFPVKMLGMNCLVNNYTIYNIESNTYAFYVPNVNVNYSWTPIGTSDDYNYNNPKRITASSDDGLYVALQDTLCYFPATFDNNISNLTANPDYFSCGILFTKLQINVSNVIPTFAGISITFKDANMDPAYKNMYSSLKLGLYILPDSIYDPELMDNLFNDTWWQQHQRTFTRQLAVNVYVAEMNINCQSSWAVIRFSPFTNIDAPQYNLQKFSVENVMVNVLR